MSASTHSTPYSCPYCAEEDLRPLAAGDVPGLDAAGWHCRSCLRVFSLRFFGLHHSQNAYSDSGSDSR